MNDSYDCMLTTVDNPYNPFEQFALWFLFDVQHGYNSCGRIARVAKLSEDLSQVEYDREKERAIDEIVLHDPTNIYTKAIKQLNVINIC